LCTKPYTREGEEQGRRGERVSVLPSGLSPKVIKVFQDVGVLLSRYTSGKIPKAFKIIPNLSNWEEILYITEPEKWTPHAVYQATRLFVSNLNNRLAQRFLALVLLPAFRADIRNNRRLHFAHFQALKKATYKAGAFYKGILIPLCSSGTCTLREAVILSSVIKRASIPVLHSAAALLRLAELPYCGTTSFFMRVLLDKKYALPYRVVDAMVDHFISFQREERQLPVVWHQALLCFVQRYKSEIREEDKDVLRALCKRQHHYLVSAEVIRELDAAARASRGSGGATNGVDNNTNSNNHNSQQVESVVGKHVLEDPRDLAPIILMDD
jgi:essential nuclear protein 1